MVRILIVEIRLSSDRLISTLGFPIPVRWHLHIVMSWAPALNIPYLPSSHAMMGGCRACCEMAQLFHLAFISAVLSFCKIQIKIWLQDKRGQYSWSDKCAISSNLMHFCDFAIRGIMDQQLKILSWRLKFSSHLIEMYRLKIMFLPRLVKIAAWIKVKSCQTCHTCNSHDFEAQSHILPYGNAAPCWAWFCVNSF